MSEFIPFADSKAAWTLPSVDGGEFTVENGRKKIIANGEIVITNDAEGIKTAEDLVAFFQSVLNSIKK